MATGWIPLLSGAPPHKLRDGRVGLLVNPTEDNHMVIVEIPMVRIISVQYSSVGGRDKAVKVVLSNRDPYEFTQVPLIYKVLSLDVEGHYTYSEYDVKSVADIEKSDAHPVAQPDALRA